MRRACYALAAYVGIAVVFTWPLTRGIAHDVAYDLGDSVLIMWVLSWDCTQLLAILRGDVGRVATFFNANIFYPAPLTLAYAEHLIAQAVQILPVYALTKNPILCYNLLFLSTFVLSGFGTFLFVRELTGNPRAGFVAGLVFAFAPYRVPQSPHLQVLSSQWMPLALYGFRRYFAAVERGERGTWPLAGASLAMIAQNLSCGYYLLYFPPFAAAYIGWELLRRRFTGRPGVWLGLSTAAVVVLVTTAPFLLPYAALREQLGFQRSPAEVRTYSADVYSYATATPEQMWGRVLREYPKPEGDLFPGAVPLGLALLALVAWRPMRATPPSPAGLGMRVRWLPPLLAALAAAHLLLAIVTLLSRRIAFDVVGVRIQVSDINQLLIRAVILIAALIAVSPPARAHLRAFAAERGFFLAALIAAVWLSFGIGVEVRGRPVGLIAPYRLFFDHVPGFDGVRVPARFGMIVTLFLAVLAGYGASAIDTRRRTRLLLVPLSVFLLAESAVLPFLVNGSTPVRGYNMPEQRLHRPARAPAIYRAFSRQPGSTVLAELPLGEPDFDLRAMYYSSTHWRPILNGYSGFYPPHYGRLALALSDVPRFPDTATSALRQQGATHVIVHESAYLEDRGERTTTALMASGAREVARAGTDVLLQLP